MMSAQQLVASTARGPAHAGSDGPSDEAKELGALFFAPTLSHADAVRFATMLCGPLEKAAAYFRHLALARCPRPPFLPTDIDPAFTVSANATLEAVLEMAQVMAGLPTRDARIGPEGEMVHARTATALAIAHGGLLQTLSWIAVALDASTMERWGMLGKGLPRFPPDASTGGITKQPDPIADMRPVFVAAFVNPAIVCTTPFQALEKHPALRRRLAKRPDNTEASALFLMLADPARQLFERADWTTAPEAELRMAMMALTNRGRALVSILLQDPAPARAYRSCALAEGRYDVLGALAAALGRIASVARSRRMHNTGPAENTAGLLAASLGIRGREEGWATAQTEDSEKRMGEMAAKEREDDAGAGADRCDACGKEERGGQKLMWCGKCGFARYCSTACQRGDWKAGHGAVCILVPAPGFGRAADGGARVKVGK